MRPPSFAMPVVRLEGVREPEIEAGDDVVIDVEADGICGTVPRVSNVSPGHRAGWSGAGRE